MVSFDELIKPKDKPHDWKEALNGLDGDRLKEVLGEVSPVYLSIKKAGRYLLSARKIAWELESDGVTTAEEIPDAMANKAMLKISHFARIPTVRFFTVFYIMNPILLMCISKQCPENYSKIPSLDVQYHAAVSYSFYLQARFLMNRSGEPEVKPIIQIMQLCLKARPSDASMHVSFGNFLMVNGFNEDARTHLEKAVEIDEGGCFNSHYTLANILTNCIPPMPKVNRMKAIHQIQARAFCEAAQMHYKKYLDYAPAGHWHVARACFCLIGENATISARGNERIDQIAKHHPNFCEENHALFERGVDAFKLYTNTFGRESSDFKRTYKSAAWIISQMHQLGLVPDKEIPDCEYICGNETCPNEGSLEPLKKCAKCSSVRYCCRECQEVDWKNRHKRECKKLKEKRQEQREKVTHKQKLMDSTSPKIGDE